MPVLMLFPDNCR